MNYRSKTLLPDILYPLKVRALKDIVSEVKNNALALIAGWFIASLGPGSALAETDMEEVSLQLHWFHQFQFAGYYAAAEKGYYKDAELKVVIKEISPPTESGGIGEVLAGKSNYGVTLSSVVPYRLRGSPVVVLAVIFQHSPAVMIARADSGVTNLHDIQKVRVASLGLFDETPEIIGMILQEGLPFAQIKGNLFPYGDNLDKFINGETDVIPGYLTDQPFDLKKKGIPYVIINPLSYGIDFYGDCLYTSEREVKEHPERTAKFLEASLRGWEYAMANTEEIIALILSKYDVEKRGVTRDRLRFEAEAMHRLILPELVEIGHMNPRRWERMATI